MEIKSSIGNEKKKDVLHDSKELSRLWKKENKRIWQDKSIRK